MATGTPLHEIVVICHRRDLCEQAAEVLRLRGIPAFVRGDEYRQTESTMLVEACAAWVSHGRERSGYRLSDILRRWRSALGKLYARAKAVEMTELLLRYDRDGEAKASQLIEDLLGIGLAQSLQDAERSEDLAELNAMREALTTGQLSTLSIAGLGERVRRSNRVEVTTMVSSKGLEFDAVFLLGVDEKWIPDFRSFSNSLELAEDRRKFYVSLTRARNEARFLYSGFVTWGNGRRDDTRPSRFLSDIGVL